MLQKCLTISIDYPIVKRICSTVNKQYKKDYSSVINLSSNEMCSETITKMFNEYIRDLRDYHVHKYPYYDSVTIHAADYFAVDKGNILLTSGTNNAIFVVLNALSKFMSRMVIEKPNYESYFEYANLNQIDIIELEYDGDPKLEKKIRVIEEQKNCIVEITSPHGWSGMKVDWDVMKNIAGLCKKNGNILIMDEAYAAYGSVSYIQLIKEFDNVIIIKSLSKHFGIASLRVGLIISSSDIISYLARWCPSNSISQFSLDFFDYLINHSEVIDSVVGNVIENREKIKNHIVSSNLSVKVFDTYTNFVTLQFEKKKDLESIIEVFDKHKIRIKRLDFEKAYDKCIRITIPEKMDEKFLELLRNFQTNYF